MEHQDQKAMETLESQISACSEERLDESCAIRSYRSPQVFLVGKAERLIAGAPGGNWGDTWGNYCNCRCQ
jgi:hypothetical protein